MPKHESDNPSPCGGSEGDEIRGTSLTSNFDLDSVLAHPYTFTQIIDADHFTIQRLAARIRKVIASCDVLPSSSGTVLNESISIPDPPAPTPTPTPSSTAIRTALSLLKPLLHEATWRLIRHDLSEDLVMRPAFVSFLGVEEGSKLAQHDRADHASARTVLLAIIGELNALEEEELVLNSRPQSPSQSQLQSHSHTRPTAVSSQHQHQHQHQLQSRFRDFAVSIIEAFDTLNKHMEIESGEFLPYFETRIDGEISRRLAREYSATLVLGPFVTLCCDAESATKQKDKKTTNRVKELAFGGGVIEYVNADLKRMKEVYRLVLEDANLDRGGYLIEEVQKEIERLQVGKWMGLNDRKTWSKTEIENQGRGKL